MPTSARYNKQSKASRVAKLFMAGEVGNIMEFGDIRGNRMKEFREGTHSQMWRVDTIEGPRQKVIGAGANLGEMGELGDDTVLYIKSTQLFEDLCNERFIDKNWVFKKLITVVYRPLKNHLLSLINAWVPNDSGELLRSMARSITQRGGSQIQDFPFLVMLNSRGVEYGKVVNNMPTSWLKHGGRGDVHAMLGRRTKSRHDGHVLNDPKAKNQFYNFILMSGRKEAAKLYKVFRKVLFKKLKESLNTLYSGREINNIAGALLIPHYNNMYEK